jgi:hypothetical protein
VLGWAGKDPRKRNYYFKMAVEAEDVNVGTSTINAETDTLEKSKHL